MEEGAKYFEKALQLDPDHLDARFNLALVFSEGKQTDRAEETLREVLERAPGKTEAWLALGSLYANQVRYEQAVHCFERALAVDPSEPRAYALCAKCYFLSGNQEKSDLLLERARRLGIEVDAPWNKK
jgi:tetratricopeptide (TPR) repeat protein